jgi:hypothetical protein
MTSGSGKRIRRRMLTARFDEAEFEVVATAAEKAGLTVSSYARETLLGAPAPRQVRRPPVERKELVRLLGELGKIGGNLNQLAKAVHTGVLVYAGELDAALAGVLETRDAILRALGREP